MWPAWLFFGILMTPIVWVWFPQNHAACVISVLVLVVLFALFSICFSELMDMDTDHPEALSDKDTESIIVAIILSGISH
jgi:divalent metal cation (Fe/Co/Zn/Cd) transporter